MPTFYAFRHMYSRSARDARTGHRIGRYYAFASRAARDGWVANDVASDGWVANDSSIAGTTREPIKSSDPYLRRKLARAKRNIRDDMRELTRARLLEYAYIYDARLGIDEWER